MTIDLGPFQAAQSALAHAGALLSQAITEAVQPDAPPVPTPPPVVVVLPPVPVPPVAPAPAPVPVSPAAPPIVAGEPVPAVEPADEHALLPHDPLLDRVIGPSEYVGQQGSQTIGPGGDVTGGDYFTWHGNVKDRSVQTLLPGLVPSAAHFGDGDAHTDVMVRCRQLGDVVFRDMDPVWGKASFHVSGARLTAIRLAFDGFEAGLKDSTSGGQAAIYAEPSQTGAPTRLDVRHGDIDNIGGNGILTQRIESLDISDTIFSKAAGNGRVDQRSHDLYTEAKKVTLLRCTAGGRSLGNSWKWRGCDEVLVQDCHIAMHANINDNPRFLDFCQGIGKARIVNTVMVEYPDVGSRTGFTTGQASRNLLGFGEENTAAHRVMDAAFVGSTIFLSVAGGFIHLGVNATLDLGGLTVKALRGAGVDGLRALSPSGNYTGITVIGEGWLHQPDGSWFRAITDADLVDALPDTPVVP